MSVWFTCAPSLSSRLKLDADGSRMMRNKIISSQKQSCSVCVCSVASEAHVYKENIVLGKTITQQINIVGLVHTKYLLPLTEHNLCTCVPFN